MNRYRCWIQGRDPAHGQVVVAQSEAEARMKYARELFGDCYRAQQNRVCSYRERTATSHFQLGELSDEH